MDDDRDATIWDPEVNKRSNWFQERSGLGDSQTLGLDQSLTGGAS